MSFRCSKAPRSLSNETVVHFGNFIWFYPPSKSFAFSPNIIFWCSPTFWLSIYSSLTWVLLRSFELWRIKRPKPSQVDNAAKDQKKRLHHLQHLRKSLPPTSRSTIAGLVLAVKRKKCLSCKTSRLCLSLQQFCLPMVARRECWLQGIIGCGDWQHWQHRQQWQHWQHWRWQQRQLTEIKGNEEVHIVCLPTNAPTRLSAVHC